VQINFWLGKHVSNSDAYPQATLHDQFPFSIAKYHTTRLIADKPAYSQETMQP